VLEVLQDLEGLPNNGVRFLPPDVDHEADAARIVFVPRVIQALSVGRHHLTPDCSVLHLGLSPTERL
jgi:hypothetical protein